MLWQQACWLLPITLKLRRVKARGRGGGRLIGGGMRCRGGEGGVGTGKGGAEGECCLGAGVMYLLTDGTCMYR